MRNPKKLGKAKHENNLGSGLRFNEKDVKCKIGLALQVPK